MNPAVSPRNIRAIFLCSLLTLAGCTTTNTMLISLAPNVLQVTSKLPDGRKLFDISDPDTINDLTWFFDKEVTWREAVSPSEKQGWSGQNLTIFFSAEFFGQYTTVPVFVHDNFTYKNGFVAETNWSRIAEILGPFLFLPNEYESFEVFAAGEFRDPLTNRDLRLMENRAASGGGFASVTLWRVGGKKHELKRPILLKADESIFKRHVTNLGYNDSAKVRYIVQDSGDIKIIEVIESSSGSMAYAASAYIESMEYEPGIFDSWHRDYRVTREFAFDTDGNLLEPIGIEYVEAAIEIGPNITF